MSNRNSALLIGAGLTALTLLSLAMLGAAPTPASGNPSEVADSLDLEALARMIASENPRGSIRLWVEQIWTQLRSRKRGQSIYDRITGGKGWGEQGSARPVATVNAPTAQHFMVARLVLLGDALSEFGKGRKFFEPRQQDLAFRVAETARAKLAKGEALTEQERRLLGYRHDADGIRRKWATEGSRLVGIIDDVEFWT